MTAVVHAVATRPNFVKMAPVIDALARTRGFRQIVVHTGQHYDRRLTDDVIGDLGFPEPDRFLGVGSGTHGEQTAGTLTGFERVLIDEEPDLVVVAGDVNATLACALAAAKLGIPIAHVEAGLRCGERDMPEEINRALTDRVADFLFTHSPEAAANLAAEGIDADRVYYVGNTMIDSLRRFEHGARPRTAWRRYGAVEGEYVLVTLHRPSNVDHGGRLAAIVTALGELATRAPVLFPAHPRTLQRLADEGELERLTGAGVACFESVGYLDFLSLEAGAGAILTDSGGVQEEASALGVPCFTLRRTTERPITLTHGTNVLLGDDPAAIAQVRISRRRPTPCAIPFWDGHAGERVAAVLAHAFRTVPVRTVGALA